MNMIDNLKYIIGKFVIPKYPEIVGFNIRTLTVGNISTCYDVKFMVRSRSDAIKQRKMLNEILCLFRMLGPSEREIFQVWFSLD